MHKDMAIFGFSKTKASIRFHYESDKIFLDLDYLCLNECGLQYKYAFKILHKKYTMQGLSVTI